MAGTDPINDTMAVNLDLERRKEIQRLRSLFIRPHKVFLVTTCPESLCETPERWLSDNYVLVKVTGSVVLEADHVENCRCEFADGAYSLMASKGLTPITKAVLVPDTAGLINSLANRPDEWLPMHRTSWSMADSEAKLMLTWVDFDPDAFATAVNEGIWQAFVDAYRDLTETEPQVRFEYLNEETPYRVTFNGEVVGYVAHAEFPENMHDQAHVLVDWLVTHS